MDTSSRLFDWIQLFFFIGILLASIPALGTYMARVFTGQRTVLHPVCSGLELLCYRLGGVDPDEQMSWKDYGKALLAFNVLGLVFVLTLQFLQQWLPLNPQHFPAVGWSLALNTALSFVTNTNWQSYSGETTLSYLTQMLGLAVQNFLSAATGLAALLVLVRGLTAKSMDTVGNFWQDMVRSVVYLLLPLSIVMALFLVSQGVVQTFSPYVEVITLEGAKQTIAVGPVASQVAIKQLGTNGGGFFNANSTHPFENPSALSNFVETLALVLIPAALTVTYGILIGLRRHGWLLFMVMSAISATGLMVAICSEHVYNPVVDAYPVLEGQETRFTRASSVLWAILTTDTANGSVNAMHSSLAPLAGGVALFNIMLGELIFGGVGVGLCSMIMFALLTVFLAGLMVGRTPEYLGKKIERQEMQWVMAAVLIPGALVLIGAGLSSVLPVALVSLGNQGPHGLTEILYAFASAAGNNGSAFAGLNANTDYYNLSLGFAILVGRVAIILPSLAIGGLLAKKKITPPSAGTFSVNTPLFAVLLVSVILIVGALAFFPALLLGPIVEQFLMIQNRVF